MHRTADRVDGVCLNCSSHVEPGKNYCRHHIEYYRARSIRKHGSRAVTVPRRELERLNRLERLNPPAPETGPRRPKVRRDCQYGQRPCPWVSCKHHLYLDVSSNGSIKFNFPDVEVHELGVTCALDVADRGGAKLEQVAALLNVTRERARQLQEIACSKIMQSRHLPVLREHSQ